MIWPVTRPLVPPPIHFATSRAISEPALRATVRGNDLTGTQT